MTQLRLRNFLGDSVSSRNNILIFYYERDTGSTGSQRQKEQKILLRVHVCRFMWGGCEKELVRTEQWAMSTNVQLHMERIEKYFVTSSTTGEGYV